VRTYQISCKRPPLRISKHYNSTNTTAGDSIICLHALFGASRPRSDSMWSRPHQYDLSAARTHAALDHCAYAFTYRSLVGHYDIDTFERMAEATVHGKRDVVNMSTSAGSAHQFAFLTTLFLKHVSYESWANNIAQCTSRFCVYGPPK
jgi:hypothetical protein